MKTVGARLGIDEESLDLLQGNHEAIDFLLGVVEIKTGAGGGFQPELAHQGLVAVVAAAEGDAILVGEGDDVVGVRAGPRIRTPGTSARMRA